MTSIIKYPSGESQTFDSQARLIKDNTRSRWGVGLVTAVGVGVLAVPAGAVFCGLSMGLLFGGLAGVVATQVSLSMIALGGIVGAVGGGFVARDAARDSMDESLRRPSTPQTFSEKLSEYRQKFTHLNDSDTFDWSRPAAKPVAPTRP